MLFLKFVRPPATGWLTLSFFDPTEETPVSRLYISALTIGLSYFL